MSSDNRFVVTKTDESASDYAADEEIKTEFSLTPQIMIKAKSEEFRTQPDAGTKGDKEGKGHPALALYEEELMDRPRISTILAALNSYSNLMPTVKDNENQESKEFRKTTKLNTVMGVYLPCVQNILGVILFVRLPWIVGLAGIIESFFVVFLCVCTTLLTSISMSAIATNGVVPAGGSYFMISRALGPEFGGAVGLLFYLGTTFASSLYILGAVEIILSYIAPGMSLFGEFSGPENIGALFNNYRVYGTLFLLAMSMLVFVGVKVVNKFASIFLACVIVSILAIYVGIIKSAFDPPDLKLCFVGNRLLPELKGDKVCAKFVNNETTSSMEPSTLYRQYCTQENSTWNCNPYFEANNVSQLPGVPGLGSHYTKANVFENYLKRDDHVISSHLTSNEVENDTGGKWLVADLTSTFTILLAIFFPSVTGIMAGSNRSGDLADGQRSIPKGTIGAVVTTGIIYLSCVALFGLCIQGPLLRDKFGDSIGKEMIVSIIAWPSKWLILFGAFLSTIGAGLQSLTGAPRLLQAIAKDGIIPFLNIFAHGKANGEPTWALLLTSVISCSGILIANLDLVAPIITMFFLMCYMFVNLACALHSLLMTPNWRPRFQLYHWVLSLIGVGLCITLMFISSWYYALAALALAATIYKYIEYSGAEKEWGDGLRGLQLTTARFALLRLEDRPPHTKNWRPQILVLVKFDQSRNATNEGLLAFAEQLKAGKGLTVVGSVLEGERLESRQDAKEIQTKLIDLMQVHKIKGFQQVLVSTNVREAISSLIQTAGLGGMRPNTVVIGWPYSPCEKPAHSDYSVFLHAIREASDEQNAVLIPKYGINFPTLSDDAQTGTIDVWWVVHDGGLLMLLPFLLRKHKLWKNCKTRIYTVAKMTDNSVQMKKDLVTFLYQLRIQADVEVIEVDDSDISAYTYERTLRMEQRTEILQKLQLTKRESLKDVHQIIERSRNAPINNSTGGLANAVSEHVGARIVNSTSSNRIAPDPRSEEGVSLHSVGTEETMAHKNVSILTWSDSRNVDRSEANQMQLIAEGSDTSSPKPKKRNVRRMHTAMKLNEVIFEKSRHASLVILNLPGPPKAGDGSREGNYMEFLEVLTEGLDRVLMVRGGGREVITIYS